MIDRADRGSGASGWEDLPPESGDSLAELVTLNLALQVPQTCGREGHWELRKPLDLALGG